MNTENNEKKNNGFLKKAAIPAAACLVLLLLGLNIFSAYKYFGVKADIDKLYAQNEEYENSMLELATLSAQNAASNNAVSSGNCGNPNCSSYCQGNCTGDCQGNCGSCGSCVVYSGSCPWDDDAWLDKFADIIAGKQEKTVSDSDIEDEEELTGEYLNDLDYEDTEADADDEDSELTADSKSKKTTKKTAKRSASLSRSSNANYNIDPALQLYYQLLNSPEFQRQLAYYNALRRYGYVNWYGWGGSGSSNSSSSSSSSTSETHTVYTTVPVYVPTPVPSNPNPDPVLPPEVGSGIPYTFTGFAKNVVNANRNNSSIQIDDSAESGLIDKAFYDNWDAAYQLAHPDYKPDHENYTPKNKKHTMILYMLSSNLERDGEHKDLTVDLENLLKYADYDASELNVVLCIGGAEQYQNEYLRTYIDGIPSDASEDDLAGSDYRNMGGCAMFYVDMKKIKADKDNGIEPVIGKDTLLYLGNIVDEGKDKKQDITYYYDGNPRFCDMANPKTLETAIDIAYTNFGADEYSLIMWDHGAGITGGFGSQEIGTVTGALPTDDNYKAKSAMPIKDIQTALNNSYVCNYTDEQGNSITGKFSFIGFDACLMGGIETAAALSPYADYLVASAETTSGGWDYANIANKITEYIDTTDSAYVNTPQKEKSKYIAEMAAESYAGQESHHANDSCEDHVVACFDLDEVGNIMQGINDVSEAINALSSSTPAVVPEDKIFEMVHRARAKAYSYGIGSADRGGVGFDFVDVKDFYSLLKDELKNCAQSSEQDVKAVIDKITALEGNYDSAISKAYADWLKYNNYDDNNKKNSCFK